MMTIYTCHLLIQIAYLPKKQIEYAELESQSYKELMVAKLPGIAVGEKEELLY